MADVSHVAQHVQFAKPIIHTVLVGVTYMTALIASGVSLLAGFGLGWYIKGRGMAGIKIDIDNVKKEIEILKNRLSAPVVVNAPQTSPAV